MRKPKTKMTPFTVHFSADTLQGLRQVAKDQGVSVAEFIRGAATRSYKRARSKRGK